jgi:hypothetical protein
MSSGIRNRRVGIALFFLLLAGAAILAGNFYFEHTRRHVVVEILDADDTVRVDVDCRRAGTVIAGDDVRTFDLGWLAPDEPVSISVSNDRGGAAWGYRVRSNGKVVAEVKPGALGSADPFAEEFAVAMVATYAATGRPLGSIGCDRPDFVPADAGDYQYLPGAGASGGGPGAPTHWSAAGFPVEPVHDAAAWVIPVLVALGYLAALGTKSIRDFLRSPLRIGIVATLLLVVPRAVELALGFGLSGALVYVAIFGILLLVCATVVSIWPHTGSPCQDSSSTLSPNEE